MKPHQLFASPFTDYGMADEVIGESRISEVVDILSEISRHANPAETQDDQKDTA